MHRAQIRDLHRPEHQTLLVDGHLLRLGGGRRLGSQCGAHPRGDFPKVAAKFPTDGGIGRVIASFCTDAAQPVMEPVLGAPTHLTQGRLPVGYGGQAAFDGPLQARAESITMSRLDQYSPQMDIAGFGDVTASLRSTAGGFARDEPDKGHERGRAANWLKSPASATSVAAEIQSMPRKAWKARISG